MKNKKTFAIFVIFLLVSILFIIFSTKVRFHDTPEYITTAKELAGISNTDTFIAHSILYPWFLSQFIKIFPSLLTIKLLNMFWLVLDALLLLYLLRNKKAFLLFIFSPLTWYISPQISPILPVSFFVLLSYITIKKYLLDKSKINFIISALSLGLSAAIYIPSLVIILLFILIFFYDRKFNEIILFIILILIGIMPRLILDQIYFNFPFYTLLRYLGANLIVALGYNKGTNLFLIARNPKTIIYFLFLISPLLFFIYKIDFKKYKKEVIFTVLLSLFFVIRGALIKYSVPFYSIILIILATCLDKKKIFINTIISLILIIIFTMSFFGQTDDSLIKDDIKNLNKDFHFKEIISSFAPDFDSLCWDENCPKVIWLEEYIIFLENKKSFVDYSFVEKPNLNVYKILNIKVILERKEKDYSLNIPLFIRKGEKPLEDYSLTKCYNMACLYEKKK